jgi:hypothetical protein
MVARLMIGKSRTHPLQSSAGPIDCFFRVVVKFRWVGRPWILAKKAGILRFFSAKTALLNRSENDYQNKLHQEKVTTTHQNKAFRDRPLGLTRERANVFAHGEQSLQAVDAALGIQHGYPQMQGFHGEDRLGMQRHIVGFKTRQY